MATNWINMYSEYVKKARKLHSELGEHEFRRRYEKRPAALARDLGAKSAFHGSQRADGLRILQAFPFFPLQLQVSEVYERIVDMHKKEPVVPNKIGYPANQLVHVLKERGVIRLAKARTGGVGIPSIVVSEVFHGGKWSKAVVPKKR